jgi:hypothetical protein
VISISKVFYYKNKEEWWHEQCNNATRGLFERLEKNDPILFKEFKTVAFEEIEKNTDDKGVRFNAEVLLGYGIK